MAKRLFDVVASALGIVLLLPIFALAYFGVKVASSGPAIYRARRVGRFGETFVMHKFRTMHIRTGTGSVITGSKDPRVFWVGRILRALKIDELPQLYDILIGKMSIVGPRPEDPTIVEQYYTPLSRETLTVAPGLSSPGSIHYYQNSDLQLDDSDPERSYVANLLPIKLALDLVYIRRASLCYDLTVILKTAATILLIALGKREFVEPREFAEARELIEDSKIPLVVLNARPGQS